MFSNIDQVINIIFTLVFFEFSWIFLVHFCLVLHLLWVHFESILKYFIFTKIKKARTFFIFIYNRTKKNKNYIFILSLWELCFGLIQRTCFHIFEILWIIILLVWKMIELSFEKGKVQVLSVYFSLQEITLFLPIHRIHWKE